MNLVKPVNIVTRRKGAHDFPPLTEEVLTVNDSQGRESKLSFEGVSPWRSSTYAPSSKIT